MSSDDFGDSALEVVVGELEWYAIEVVDQLNVAIEKAWLIGATIGPHESCLAVGQPGTKQHDACDLPVEDNVRFAPVDLDFTAWLMFNRNIDILPSELSTQTPDEVADGAATSGVVVFVAQAFEDPDCGMALLTVTAAVFFEPLNHNGFKGTKLRSCDGLASPVASRGSGL